MLLFCFFIRLNLELCSMEKRCIVFFSSFTRQMKRHITYILQLMFFRCYLLLRQFFFVCSFFIQLRQMHIFHGCKPVALIHSFDYYNIHSVCLLCVCFFLSFLLRFSACRFIFVQTLKSLYVMNAKSKILSPLFAKRLPINSHTQTRCTTKRKHMLAQRDSTRCRAGYVFLLLFLRFSWRIIIT